MKMKFPCIEMIFSCMIMGEKNYARGKIIIFMHGNYIFMHADKKYKCMNMIFSCMKFSCHDFFILETFCVIHTQYNIAPLKIRTR